MTRGITAMINNYGRAFLQQTGLMQKVKKIWRRAGSGVKQNFVVGQN